MVILKPRRPWWLVVTWALGTECSPSMQLKATHLSWGSWM